MQNGGKHTQKQPDVRLSTITRIENAFSAEKGWTARGLADELGFGHAAVKVCLNYLIQEGKIRELPASSRGTLYVQSKMLR